MAQIWVPPTASEPKILCKICGETFRASRRSAFEGHLKGCIERNQDFIDSFRPAPFEFGDPELGAFAREEGDVWNRRPGTRKRPR